jgi:hypothetical protein
VLWSPPLSVFRVSWCEDTVVRLGREVVEGWGVQVGVRVGRISWASVRW